MILGANNDRVRETTSTVGAGALALLGAVVGFRAFSAVLNDQDVRPYTIEGLNSGGGPSGEWETGLGTFNAGLNTLSRTTVLASSNAGAAVVFSAGAKQVWIDAPAAFLSGLLQAGNNLADVANVATARHSLGLDAVDAPTFAGLTLTGAAKGADGTAAAPGFSFSAEPGTGMRRRTGNTISFTNQNIEIAQMNPGRFACVASIGIASGDLATISPDVNLFRDAANILALRNGANAQLFKVYNTFTDASNYERLEIGFSSNAARLQATAAGTGVLRNIQVNMAAGTSFQILSNGSAVWQFTTTTNDLTPSVNNQSDLGRTALGVRNLFMAGGIRLKLKAGAILDTDFTNPEDGMIAADSTNSKLWMRLGGVWKSVVLA